MSKRRFSLSWTDLQRPDSDSNFVPLSRALERWSDRYRIRTDWMLDIAVHTLWYWEMTPEAMLGRWVSPPVNSEDVFSFEERQFNFTNAGWDPIRRPWKEFSARVRKEFEQTLRAHKNALVMLALRRGCVAAPKKRELDHFRWLVLYQVKRESLTDVAKQAGPGKSPNTVFKAIAEVAKRIDLPLRTHINR